MLHPKWMYQRLIDLGSWLDWCVTCLADPKQRISVPVGYDSEGALGVALLLEEVKDSEEKMDSSWSGTLWKHTRWGFNIDENGIIIIFYFIWRWRVIWLKRHYTKIKPVISDSYTSLWPLSKSDPSRSSDRFWAHLISALWKFIVSSYDVQK